MLAVYVIPQHFVYYTLLCSSPTV